MASINVEMAVSGAQKCQQQIREVSTQVKAMQSALKLADSEFKLTGDATAMYTSKIQTLQAQIAAQNQAVEAARQGLEHMSTAYGASSSQAMQWQSKVNTAQTSLNNMTASLRDMQAKLAESTSAMAATGGAADALSGALSGMAGGSYSMDGLNSSLGATQGEIQKTREQLGDLQEQVKETGGLFYNVGNMSISAANGGKVASAITGIAKEITSLVKSSGETAQNTGGLLNGGMSAGGVMSTVGGIVSNFGPWGAVAGSILDMGGAIIDTIQENQRAQAQREREQRYQEYWAGGMSATEYDNLVAALSASREVTATLDADVQAQVTAKVDGLRVIIDEITEDGKVNTREVGSVRKYVQDVLMADYDEAVEDLHRMRGELWKIATAGFSAEEVTAYSVESEEEGILYSFFKAALADPDIAWSQAKEVLNGADLDALTTQMWLDLSAKFGSKEAMMEAARDPAQAGLLQQYISEWLQEQFKGDITPAQANMFAANMTNHLRKLAGQGWQGVDWTVGSEWLTTTEGGGFFTSWVQQVLSADEEDAEAEASALWEDLMASCANPSEAANAIWQSSGAEAAAAYQAGDGSGTASAFGVMVAWVQAHLGADKEEAVSIAVGMWDAVRQAATHGIDDSGVDHREALQTTYTFTGSTAMRDYIAARMGTDFEAAINQANAYWDGLIKAMNGETAGAEGGDMRATLLQQALADYKSTLEEIDEVTGEMPNLTGSALEAKIKELEALLTRAEQLANRVELLRGDELTQAKGAYNLVTYGTGAYGEQDVETAFSYLNTLRGLAEQDRADRIAAADAERYKTYSDDNATEEQKAAAEEAYAQTVAEAEAGYAEQMGQYTNALVALINSVLEDKGDGSGTPTNAQRQYLLAMLESGYLDNLDIPDVTGQTLGERTANRQQTLNRLQRVFGSPDSPLFRTMMSLLEAGEMTYTSETGKGESNTGLYIPVNAQGVTDINYGGRTFATAADIPGLSLLYALSNIVRTEGYQTPWSGAMSEVMERPSWMTEDSFNKLVERFQAKPSGDKGAKLPSDFDDTDAQAAMAEAGENLANSLAASIDANAPTAEAAGTRLGQNVAAAVRAALQIASPSKLMQQYGTFTAEGLAEGIDAGITRVARASGRMAAAVARPVAAAAGGSGTTYNNTATSSLFVENYYQRSDADIDVLAASIADKNRLTRMGNGIRT